MNGEQKAVLDRLEFDGVVRCDAVVSYVRCKEKATLGLRCRSCRELAVFCQPHVQTLSVAVGLGHVARCGGCGRTTTTLAELFARETIR